LSSPIWRHLDRGRERAEHQTSDRPSRPRCLPAILADGKWIAFSSDRNGNLDVYVIPVEGGAAKQLTFHSADDSVQGWTPDGRAVLFASQRGEDFMGKLYTVNVDDQKERSAGSTWAFMRPSRPTERSWPSIANRNPTGANTIAALTRPM